MLVNVLVAESGGKRRPIHLPSDSRRPVEERMAEGVEKERLRSMKSVTKSGDIHEGT